MLIACPGCDRRYQIADAAIGDAGRSVRCSRCATVWTARPEDALAAESAEFAPAPAQTVAAPLPPEPALLAAPAPGEEPKTGPAVRSIVGEPAVLHGLPPTLHLPPAIVPAELGGTLTGFDASRKAIEHHGAAERMPAEAVSSDGAPTLEARAEPQPRSGPRRPRAKPPRRKLRVKLPRGSGVAAGVATLVAALVFRAGVVEAFPATARLYAGVGLPVNLRGVEISGVQAHPDADGVLHVEGHLSGIAKKAVPLARLRIGIESEHGEELASVLIPPPLPVLAPGEDAPFSTALAGLPATAHRVTVRFEDRHAKVRPAKPAPASDPAAREAEPGSQPAPAASADPHAAESHPAESHPAESHPAESHSSEFHSSESHSPESRPSESKS